MGQNCSRGGRNRNSPIITHRLPSTMQPKVALTAFAKVTLANRLRLLADLAQGDVHDARHVAFRRQRATRDLPLLHAVTTRDRALWDRREFI